MNFLKFYLICCLLFLIQYTQAQDVNVVAKKVGFFESDSMLYLLYGQGQYEQAIPYAQKSLEITRGIDTLYLIRLGNLGLLYSELGRLEESEKLFLESIKIQEKNELEKNGNYGTTFNNLGMLYRQMGRYEEAVRILIKAEQINTAVKGKNDPNRGLNLNNLALVYQDMGRYEEAEHLLLEAKSIWANTVGKNHIWYISALNNLTSIYKATKGYEEVKILYSEIISLVEKNLGKTHPHYASSLSNLAGYYQSIGKYEEAEKVYLEVLKIDEKIIGKGHINYISSATSLASCYSKIKRYNEAEKLLLEGLKGRAVLFGKEHPSYVMGLNHLVNLYLKINKLDTAWSYCMAAIDANSSQIDSSFTDLSSFDKYEYYSLEDLYGTLDVLLRILEQQYKNTQNKEKLKDYYKVATASLRLNERIKNEFSNENNKLRILKINSRLVTSLLKVIGKLEEEKYKEEAFSFSELNKSILLADALKANRARALGDLPDSLILKEMQLQKKSDDLKKQQARAGSADEKNKLASAVNEVHLQVEAFKKELKNKYPHYHSLKYENITAKVTDIQSFLMEDALFLEYFVADSMVYLFSIDKQKMEMLALPIPKAQLSIQIQLLREALTNPKDLLKNGEQTYKNYTKTAWWFYDNLLRAALKNQPKIKNLIIVTDGELGHLPFEAFLVESASDSVDYTNLHYLLKDYNVSYNYSATLWKENLQMSERKNNGKLFAFASDYNLKTDDANSRHPHLIGLRNDLHALPAAQEEVKILSENFSGTFLQGAEANESFFKENAHEYSIIHLAMHGLLNKTQPILSSLAFSENNDTLNDNFLEAYEISRLHLNADLVVLSACETGYGKFEQGEGVVSLARSFMYAGVPSLVVSLWQVNDHSTAFIMQYFYQYLAKGMQKDAALRQAKLDYIAAAEGIAAHPNFWSAFIQLGDSRPIKIGGKTNWLWWLVGGGLVSVIGIGVAFRRRKV